jgi:N-methylhydantoinase A
MGYRVGIDSGGTFTDLLAIDERGRRELLKVPSTPESPDLGFRNALDSLIERLDGDSSQIEAVLHGTTVAVNAILQRKFPTIGLLVTKGFRHILELARQTVPGERGSIYVWVKPPRIVHLSNVREVTERVTAKGEVLTAFDEAECREAARWYRDQGIGTVAICFINAYVNPDHERRAKEIFKEESPTCHVATSSETLPEFREYERAITTCMNALLMPILGAYVDKLRTHLTEIGLAAPLYIMKSGGGASHADLAVEQPVHTALSGPAAAVAGSAWLGRQADMNELITFDMGGTSTDVSLIEGGYPTLVSETEVDVYPIRTPAIDVISVGAGGGSVAWLAPGDRLKVGPRSAGADPGPACYGRGGLDVTITDANFYLGRLPEQLAGGTVHLDRAKAEAALAALGERVGLSPLDLASGIIQIGEMNMADAIRQVSVQKGRDPRLFRLVASGGAGPLHACALAEILSIPEVIIPPVPGIGCSLGALVSDVREDYVMTEIQRESDANVDKIIGLFVELEGRALAALDRQGFAEADRHIDRAADLRYRGMRTELTVPVATGPLGAAAIKAMFDGLHAAHESAYGYAYEDVQQVELVNLRVAGIGRMRGVPPFQAPDIAAAAEATGSRKVYFADAGWTDAQIYDRATLGAGSVVDGPAIVQQYDSTIVIQPGERATTNAHGYMLVLTRAGAAARATILEKVPA